MEPTTTLGPYTGEDAVCPKCLYAGADTEWQGSASLSRPTAVRECLARQCRCCGFTWYEAVASPLTHALTADEATLLGGTRY